MSILCISFQMEVKGEDTDEEKVGDYLSAAEEVGTDEFQLVHVGSGRPAQLPYRRDSGVRGGRGVGVVVDEVSSTAPRPTKVPFPLPLREVGLNLP